MPQFLVQTETLTVHTRAVEADTAAEAEDRFSEGLIVHSEASPESPNGNTSLDE